MRHPLEKDEMIFFRDRLRVARYGALADAEGFAQLCFAFELLGSRLSGQKLGLGKYKDQLKCLAKNSLNSDRFDAFFRRVLHARNDAMHTGAYARNAAQAAVQLSLILEEGLMDKSSMTVADYMVTTPMYVETWHTLGYARQLMLVNSFSYLPIFHGESWKLISDIAMAKFFQSLKSDDRKTFEAQSIQNALDQGAEKSLKLTEAIPVIRDKPVCDLLDGEDHPRLWVVVNSESGDGAKQLVGVLSPFELM